MDLFSGLYQQGQVQPAGPDWWTVIKVRFPNEVQNLFHGTSHPQFDGVTTGVYVTAGVLTAWGLAKLIRAWMGRRR